MSNEMILKPRYKGKEIELEEALLKLKEIINSRYKSEVLYYRGSGNSGVMQEVTEHFFAQLGAVVSKGSLCVDAAKEGIIEGRGSYKNMPLSEIEKSEVIIFWGRNPHVSSPYLLPLLKDKKIIVIDPLKTQIAKMADLYIGLKSHGDLSFALLLTRFLHINELCDEEFLEEHASEFEDFYELTQSVRIKATLESIDVGLGDIGDFMEIIREKKVAIICGAGIQKYKDGADIMRAIDAVAVALGLFGKEGCGVMYHEETKESFTSPFFMQAKKISKFKVDFDDFKTVFIQGANPLSQMPNSVKVETALSRVENLIYFGLYENETSLMADLVIPAKSFLQKEDIRATSLHNHMASLHVRTKSESAISEYDLSAFLCKEFDIELKSEEEYLAHFATFASLHVDGFLELMSCNENPYKDGFDTDDGEFVFLEEFDAMKTEDEKFDLITPKNPKSLNSQFEREESVYLHSDLGFCEGEKVKMFSEIGSVVLHVRHNDDLRKDSVLIYSGTKGVNNLTAKYFQEHRVEITKL